jgi:hypothetical protein
VEEYGEAGLEWACSHCPGKRRADINPYTMKLLHIKAMQDGGYQYAPDDLTVEEWMDLGQVKLALAPRLTCPLMPRKNDP